MGKPHDFPAFFRPFSLTSCITKMSECIILSLVLFFLEPNSTLSPRQAGFCPGRSTLDQILYLFQSISDEFNKPRPGSLAILATIDFSKAFDWHPARHKLISAGLPPCFAYRTRFFFSDGALAWFIKITKVAPFESVKMFLKDPLVLGPVLFSHFINDLSASLPSSVSCSLYADDLTIWFFSPSVPTEVEATQGALIRLELWSECWCLPLNLSKCEASFLVNSYQANLQPHLLLLDSRLHFDSIPTFLGVTFDRTLFFLDMHLR